jgi:alkylation response protein AidB-like acyl-CoA dehydrogenase
MVMTPEITETRRQEGARTLVAAQALAPLIAEQVEEMERLRTLSPPVVEGMRAAGVFRMTTPPDWGGPELDPMQQFEVIEALSAADGSVGWCAYINSTSGYFTSFIDQDVARGLYPSLDIATGGMPIPVGRAERVDGGYRLSGRWTFGSGVKHCGWMVCGAAVHENGVPVRRADGSPEPVNCFVSSDDFTVIETWNAMGLRATGSHDFAVKDLFVPAERCFDMFGSPVQRTTPLVRFPTMYLFNHSPVALGIAQGAIDAYAEVLRAKSTPWGPLREQEFARAAIAEAQGHVDAARHYCLDTLADIYATAVDERRFTLDQRARFRLAITHAHRAAVTAVDGVFLAAGTTPAVRLPSRLERCFRDVHVANQHMIANPHTYGQIGAMLVGEEPADPTY